MNMDHIVEKMVSLPIWIYAVFIALMNFLWVFLGLWQLSVLMAILGTFFVRTRKHAYLVGFIGNITAWGIYMVIYTVQFQVMTLLSQVFQVITGIPNAGWLMFFLVLLIAGLLGVLGASIGFRLGKLIFQTQEKTE